MTDDPKYRIAWYVPSTGYTGHGTAVFPREEAQQYADAMNKDDRRNGLDIYHFIEPVEDEAKP